MRPGSPAPCQRRRCCSSMAPSPARTAITLQQCSPARPGAVADGAVNASPVISQTGLPSAVTCQRYPVLGVSGRQTSSVLPSARSTVLSLKLSPTRIACVVTSGDELLLHPHFAVIRREVVDEEGLQRRQHLAAEEIAGLVALQRLGRFPEADRIAGIGIADVAREPAPLEAADVLAAGPQHVLVRLLILLPLTRTNLAPDDTHIHASLPANAPSENTWGGHSLKNSLSRMQDAAITALRIAQSVTNALPRAGRML